MSAAEVIEELKSLSNPDRLAIIEAATRLIREELYGEAHAAPEAHDWMAVRGIAPHLLGAEDAQAWVSRTRREDSEHRERQWKGAP